MDGRVALLDAAENLFAERGYYGASMREITSLAGVPHGLVTYHFRSKDDLFQSVVERRIDTFLAILEDALEKLLLTDPPPSPEKIIEAYVGSHVRFAASGEAERNYMRLTQMIIAIGKRRGLIETPAGKSIPLINRYLKALQSALPEIDPEDVDCSFHILRLALAGILVDIELPKNLSLQSGEECIRRLTTFCAGGFERRLVS